MLSNKTQKRAAQEAALLTKSYFVEAYHPPTTEIINLNAWVSWPKSIPNHWSILPVHWASTHKEAACWLFATGIVSVALKFLLAKVPGSLPPIPTSGVDIVARVLPAASLTVTCTFPLGPPSVESVSRLTVTVIIPESVSSDAEPRTQLSGSLPQYIVVCIPRSKPGLPWYGPVPWINMRDELGWISAYSKQFSAYLWNETHQLHWIAWKGVSLLRLTASVPALNQS